jgi:hypothetical protein
MTSRISPNLRELNLKRLAGGESAFASAPPSNFQSRSAWISCCRPPSMSLGVM